MRMHFTFYILLGLAFSLRSWVGVVDQVNPPWVQVVSESGNTLQLHLDQTYPSVKAGDWVIYWSQQKVLELLDSPASRRETKTQETLMKSLFQLP